MIVVFDAEHTAPTLRPLILIISACRCSGVAWSERRVRRKIFVKNCRSLYNTPCLVLCSENYQRVTGIAKGGEEDQGCIQPKRKLSRPVVTQELESS